MFILSQCHLTAAKWLLGMNVHTPRYNVTHSSPNEVLQLDLWLSHMDTVDFMVDFC